MVRSGRSKKIRSWISKGIALAKKHGIPIVKNQKLISRGLSRLGTSGYLGKYSPAAQYASKFASQRGYGLRSAGGSLRSAGGSCCRRRRRRRR